MDVGRIRTAVPQGGYRLQGEAHSRRAGLSGGWEGVKEVLSALRGVMKGLLYSGRVRWGKAQYVGRCHPVPDKALHQLCQSPEAFGLSHSDGNFHPEPPVQAARKEMPTPCQRDAQTDSHAGQRYHFSERWLLPPFPSRVVSCDELLKSRYRSSLLSAIHF